jgi:hypothetical protein
MIWWSLHTSAALQANGYQCIDEMMILNSVRKNNAKKTRKRKIKANSERCCAVLFEEPAYLACVWCAGKKVCGIQAAFQRSDNLPTLIKMSDGQAAAMTALAHARYTNEIGVCLVSAGAHSFELLAELNQYVQLITREVRHHVRDFQFMPIRYLLR